VARELSAERGVIEPFQSAASVDGQTTELARQLEEEANPPATLIGHSWGAWLSVLVAARHPRLVAKLVLVGSGPFEATCAERIMPARMARLTGQEQREAQELLELLNRADGAGDDAALARFGELMNRADTFDPLPIAHEGEPLPPPHGDGAVQQAIYRGVWPEARELRASARLLDVTGRVRCPVVAIHGDHDPTRPTASGCRSPAS
jgi:pimeloyl-ACP methyl ester carboxylesterase